MTNRAWPRFEFRRGDGKANRLFEMENALWNLEHAHIYTPSVKWEPPNDVGLFRSLYIPPIFHALLPEEEGDHRVRRISVEGFTVRYSEDRMNVTMTVEGSLAEEILETLCADLRGKLERLEETPYLLIRY